MIEDRKGRAAGSWVSVPPNKCKGENASLWKDRLLSGDGMKGEEAREREWKQSVCGTGKTTRGLKGGGGMSS